MKTEGFDRRQSGLAGTLNSKETLPGMQTEATRRFVAEASGTAFFVANALGSGIVGVRGCGACDAFCGLALRQA